MEEERPCIPSRARRPRRGICRNGSSLAFGTQIQRPTRTWRRRAAAVRAHDLKFEQTESLTVFYPGTARSDVLQLEFDGSLGFMIDDENGAR